MPKYDRAACGLLTTDLAGTILEVNQTLLDWLRARRVDVVGRSFVDLLTPGGKIFHDTHFAPMISLQGAAREVAFDFTWDGGPRIPMLVNARLDRDGPTPMIQVAVFDATERRMYERELLAAKERAERSEAEVRMLASALQDTLLPNAAPSVPGLDVAAVSLPAGAGSEIGGDFYDVFEVGDDDWVIALGDVEGKGALRIWV